ncbi:hypothetical protein TSUD_126240 [Trifolium subterraneum]|uniref:RING-type domain-containing protein n=1 Tax=Trifolium subterraneum TaxID=3900 RepID=A0A2Z6N7S9_TRISU|nr:hypothetical protein TSUD_126240 [Trifolium subterraneum]
MLAAIISLLLVILFVLLLHLYAKWFLSQAHAQAQARRRRRRRTTVTVSDVLGPARFHHFHSFNIEDSPLSSSNTKGLDSSIIASIPLFIYADKIQKNEIEQELECVICLSGFENGEMGRASIVVFENDSSSNVVDGSSSFVEIVIDENSSSEIREGEEQVNENDNGRVQLQSDSVSENSSLFGCSLKTVFSKVFPSSNVNESQS